MLAPPVPVDEEARLAALRALAVLDTAPEDRFDRITRLAQRLFDTPIALVSLVDADRVWHKSVQGLGISEVPRAVSFCGHAILGSEPFVVADATEDERFRDNPLVTGSPRICSYAACPITTEDGYRVGAFAVADHEPRHLDERDLETLRDLTAVAERELTTTQLASLDPLTGLTNRRGFMLLAHHVLADADRRHEAATLLFVDVDGVTAIGSTLGAAAGDRAVLETAELLAGTLRDSDVIARIRDDEFCALLGGTGDADAAISRVRDALDRRNGTPGRAYALVLSLGGVRYQPNSGVTFEELERRAEERIRLDRSSRRAG